MREFTNHISYKIKQLGIVLFLFTMPCLTMAQYPNHEFAFAMGGWGGDRGRAVCADPSGNIYYSGVFSDYTDFDPGPDTTIIWTGNNGSGFNTYILKLDSLSNFKWVKCFIGGGVVDVWDMAIGPDGSIFITGEFYDSTDFDPDPVNEMILTTVGVGDIFISKLDSMGNFQWVRQIGNSNLQNPSSGRGITVDENSNVYVAGFFLTSMDFDPGPNNYLMTSNGFVDCFIMKLDSAGNFGWAKKFGNLGDDECTDIHYDISGALYISGFFVDTVDIDPGPGIYQITTYPTFDDFFILKLDTSGNFIWAHDFGGIPDDNAYSITTDISGNVLTTGFFYNTVDFDPGPGVFNLSASGSNSDIFVLKLDSGGNFKWAVRMGGPNGDLSRSVAVDNLGYVYNTGYFQGTADFDPGPGAFNLTSLSVSRDIFVAKLDSSGVFQWAGRMGGTGHDIGNSIFVDSNYDIFHTGYFVNGSADFDPGTGVCNLQAMAADNIYIQKLNRCMVSAGTIFPIACGSYTSPSGNYTWTNSGIYNDTIPNIYGCDSMVIINLTIIYPAVSITAQGPITFCLGGSVTLNASPSLTSYQWYRNNALIPGATNPNFTAVRGGFYKCVALNTSCVDTSNVIQVKVPCVPIGPDQDRVIEDSDNILRIYPNPGSNFVTIENDFTFSMFEIRNMQGQLIFSDTMNSGKSTIDFSGKPAGVYIIQVTESESGKVFIKKLILD